MVIIVTDWFDEALKERLMSTFGSLGHTETCGRPPQPTDCCSCGFSDALRRACRELEDEGR